jgi:hypothetical protein
MSDHHGSSRHHALHRRRRHHGGHRKLAGWLAALIAVALGVVTVSWFVGAFTSSPPRFLVPLYDQSTADWKRACSGLRSSGSLAVANIGNPGGPGASPSSAWTGNITTCHSREVGVVGYVDTGYCQVPLATALQQIDDWYRWYGAVGLSGIFVDQVSNPADPAVRSDCLSGAISALAYYQAIASHVHANAEGQTVIYNFGQNPMSSWALSDGPAERRADVAVVFEDTSTAFEGWSPARWEEHYPSSEFAVLVSAAGSADQPRSFCAAVAKQNLGYAYATPFASWNALPPPAYFADELTSC